MTRSLTGSLRETPATVPALVAIVLFVVWATSQAGYPLTHWAPGALIVLALLAIAMLVVPVCLAESPPPVKLALACLAAYTALSFLSIAWASVPADAWEGANRTLLYLMVFALFSLWGARSMSAVLLLCLWTIALIGVATYVAVRVDTATGKSFEVLFTEERLSYPVGYPNAAAAQWLMAFWPALLLARSPRLPWALRGLLAGGAVVLADVALLSQSRGSLYSLLPMVVLVFAFIPERLRTFAVAVPVALGIGATAPLVLRIGDRIQAGHSPYAATHEALTAMFLSALIVGVLVAVVSAMEGRSPISRALAGGVRRGVGALALLMLLAVLAGGLIAAGNGTDGNWTGGNVITRVRHGWESFQGGYSSTARGNRLLGGLGSARYDFYRVALDEFAAHPLVGIGADNFQAQYLSLGHSNETPRYPHSVELRTLSQAGLIGTLLAVVGLAAALVAGWRAMRRADPLGRTVAAAALAGFAYWAVHGSLDWFWEFAGLGSCAFALLGIVCSLAVPVTGTRPRAASPPSPARNWTLRALGGLAALAVSLSLAAPWLSERQIKSAASIWPKSPLTAYSRLEEAANLNPLSDRAYLVGGSIALRFGDLPRAEHNFSLALGRVPDDAYAVLELGAIASESGERGRALALLEKAARLNPRDQLTAEALQTVRLGKQVSVQQLNRSILVKAQRFA